MIRTRPLTADTGPRALGIRTGVRPLAMSLALALLASAAAVPAGPADARAPIPVEKPERPEPRVLTQADADLLREALETVRKRGWEKAATSLAGVRHPLARKVVRWMRLQESGGGTFEEIVRFADAHPDWPNRDRLLRRAEAVIPDTMAPQAVVQWFAGRDPFTGDGMLRLGEAHLASNRTAIGAAWIRRAWRDTSLSRTGETRIRAQHIRHLQTDDHEARADALIWDGKRSAAKRMLALLPDGPAKLARARIKLSGREAGVDGAIAAVPRSLQDDPGLMYERIRWRRRRDRDQETWPLLKQAPKDKMALVRPESWWIERRIQTRHALTAGKADLAYDFVRGHGLARGSHFADAEWSAGWIALRFLNDPQAAIRHFAALEANVSYPISKARAQYWLGRAAEAAGQRAAATAHYQRASKHDTTFYGQLAAEKVAADVYSGTDAVLRLPASPIPAPERKTAFRESPLARAAVVSADFAPDWVTRTLIFALIETATSAEDFALAGDLARDLDLPNVAVRVGKTAAQNYVPATDHSYPILDLPPYMGNGTEPERALVLALIRQETEFDHDAVSHANARGLMQLTPATARDTARRHGMVYKRAWLTAKPDYNSQLGRAHLSDLIEDFDGSYILTAAAYNAGASRVRQWLREFGDPREPDVDAVDWIERIPFSETRNYVQRIMETLTVYRALLAGRSTPIMLSADLKRRVRSDRARHDGPARPSAERQTALMPVTETGPVPVAPPAPAPKAMPAGLAGPAEPIPPLPLPAPRTSRLTAAMVDAGALPVPHPDRGRAATAPVQPVALPVAMPARLIRASMGGKALPTLRLETIPGSTGIR